MKMIHYKSYAKLNLFLNIINKRDDGYHNLQSMMQIIDFHDDLSFERRRDNKIVLQTNNKQLRKENIILDAAEALIKKYKIKRFGLNIKLNKKIPLGGGLGGGSSNAATTLMALSKIWNINLTKKSLMRIGIKIGSDIPFFINGRNAWVEGKGDIITNIFIPQKWYLLVLNSEKVSTRTVFDQHIINTSNKLLTYDDFMQGQVSNDFKETVLTKYPLIQSAWNKLAKFGNPQLSGTGSTIFASFDTLDSAISAQKSTLKSFKTIISKSLIN
tara:strand:+ start:432 stop:1244 length:813 start_codon:yes stop_codon:yes gene_type:complete